MPKPSWKGSAGIVEGGVTFTLSGGGSARRPERPRITNDEDERVAAREQAEALAKAAVAVPAKPAAPGATAPDDDPSGTQEQSSWAVVVRAEQSS